MKLSLLTTIVLSLTGFTTLYATDKTNYINARQEMVHMLEGKATASYERAIYLLENAWYDNSISYDVYTSALDAHTRNIQALINANREEKKFELNPLQTPAEQQAAYEKLLANWAIYTYITDTTFIINKDRIQYHLPYTYSSSDPMGSDDWRHTQVINLLDTKEGNCYALASLFRIFAERLVTDAVLCTAPGHIYISHAGEQDIPYNIELSGKTFPGTGTIETLTYTTDDATKNNIALRNLDAKQNIALCMVYLAKGYEHKYGKEDDGFMMSCATIAQQHDALNLNAMLLQAELLEAKLLLQNKTIAQLKTDADYKTYETLLTKLYTLGYREMPVDMKNAIIARYKKDYMAEAQQHTPSPFDKLKTDEPNNASLSWGLFEEVHKLKPKEQYGSTIYNTKTKKIEKFVTEKPLYNQYNFDPVVFAWNIDPMYYKAPGESPYSFAGGNPIALVDIDGLFKMIPSADVSDPKAYSVLADYLHYGVSELLNSKTIINAYKEQGISRAELEQAFAWDKGVMLEITKKPGVDELFSHGHTNSNGTIIQVSKKLIDRLQNVNEEYRQAALLIVVNTILHETVHALQNAKRAGAGDGYNSGNGDKGYELIKSIYSTPQYPLNDIWDMNDAVNVIKYKGMTPDGSKDLPTAPIGKEGKSEKSSSSPYKGGYERNSEGGYLLK